MREREKLMYHFDHSKFLLHLSMKKRICSMSCMGDPEGNWHLIPAGKRPIQTKTANDDTCFTQVRVNKHE